MSGPACDSSFQEVQWSLSSPSTDATDSKLTENSAALEAARGASKAAQELFETAFVSLENRETSVPHFQGEEIILQDMIRHTGYTTEYEFSIKTVVDLEETEFGSPAQVARGRFAERCQEDNRHYCIKYLQKGLIYSAHGPNAAAELLLEAKILSNLAPHPNISQIYGIHGDSIDAFLEMGRKAFFVITDRSSETLVERIHIWRDRRDASSSAAVSMTKRLEIALDICSALVFLHCRQLALYVRPDKVGFDAKGIKLCSFGQARQDGMKELAPSLVQSDDIRTLAYTAPEVLCKSSRVTVSSDVYAFGIMLWEIMSLQQPFGGYDRANHFVNVVQSHERPRVDENNWPKQLCELMRACWNAHTRPTMKHVQEKLETSLLFQSHELTLCKEPVRGVARSKSDLLHYPQTPKTRNSSSRRKSMTPHAAWRMNMGRSPTTPQQHQTIHSSPRKMAEKAFKTPQEHRARRSYSMSHAVSEDIMQTIRLDFPGADTSDFFKDFNSVETPSTNPSSCESSAANNLAQRRSPKAAPSSQLTRRRSIVKRAPEDKDNNINPRQGRSLTHTSWSPDTASARRQYHPSRPVTRGDASATPSRDTSREESNSSFNKRADLHKIKAKGGPGTGRRGMLNRSNSFTMHPTQTPSSSAKKGVIVRRTKSNDQALQHYKPSTTKPMAAPASPIKRLKKALSFRGLGRGISAGGLNRGGDGNVRIPASPTTTKMVLSQAIGNSNQSHLHAGGSSAPPSTRQAPRRSKSTDNALPQHHVGSPTTQHVKGGLKKSWSAREIVVDKKASPNTDESQPSAETDATGSSFCQRPQKLKQKRRPSYFQ